MHHKFIFVNLGIRTFKHFKLHKKYDKQYKTKKFVDNLVPKHHYFLYCN